MQILGSSHSRVVKVLFDHECINIALCQGSGGAILSFQNFALGECSTGAFERQSIAQLADERRQTGLGLGQVPVQIHVQLVVRVNGFGTAALGGVCTAGLGKKGTLPMHCVGHTLEMRQITDGNKEEECVRDETESSRHARK